MAALETGQTPAERIELEIVRHKLAALTREMGAVVANSAQTWEIAEQRDFALAIADRHGELAAIDNPLQLGSTTFALRAALDAFRFDMKDGDVVALNDPHRGGTHVQDLTLVAPYVVDDAIAGYLVARGHMPDLGGEHAGGHHPAAREVWAEGVPITPVKLRRHDRPVRDVIATIALNSRRPEALLGNLDALLAALRLGRRRGDELVGAHGIARVRAALDHAQGYAERRLRAALRGWADGGYDGERALDHDGAGGGPVHVRVRAEVDGDRLRLDFSGSDAERASFVNSAFGNTVDHALGALLALVDDDVPANGGVLRAVELRCAEGRVVNPRRPAAVGWGPEHCGREVAEACAAALRQACGDGGGAGVGAIASPRPLVTFRPRARRHERTSLTRLQTGGCSAADGRDGWGSPHLLSRAELPSVEQWEAEHGRRIVALRQLPDTAGAGRWRGAPAVETVVELTGEELLTLCACGREIPVAGTAGGGDGGPAAVVLVEDGDGGGARDAPATVVEQPAAPGRIAIAVGGGGGWGDPHERDAELVLADVLDGIVTATAAEAVYGVVIAGGAVDEAATTRARAQREERNDGR